MAEVYPVDSSEYHVGCALKHLTDAADIYRRQGDHAAALACLESCCAIAPRNANCANNLAHTLESIGRHDEALEICRSGIALNPQSAVLHHNHALILTSLGDEAAAIAAYAHAIQLNPADAEAHMNLGLLLARAGRWQEALREYEWRFEAHENLGTFRKRFSAPHWQGEPLEGKTIAVYCEQGMGDAIWFSRFIPCLKLRNAGQVLLEVPEELARLFRDSQGIDEVVIRKDLDTPASLPPHDYAVSILSLPHVLGVEQPQKVIPARFWVEDAFCPGRSGDSRPRIGLCWAGSAGHPNDCYRSMPPKLLCPLTDAGDFTWYTFQKGPLQRTWPDGEIDLRSGEEFPAPVIFLNDAHMSDFFATASLLREIDLLITVDTAIAHLAGTIGKPVYLMLPYQADWRWPVHGDTTDWYPTMRLFRQSSARDWAEVVQRVKIALMTALQGKGR